MLAQIARQTLVTLTTALQHTIGHRTRRLLGAFSVASQYGRAFDLRNSQIGRLLGLLCQLCTGNVILVIQADTGQNGYGNRRCNGQTTQAVAEMNTVSAKNISLDRKPLSSGTPAIEALATIASVAV